MSSVAVVEITGSGAIPAEISKGGVVFLKTAAKGDAK